MKHIFKTLAKTPEKHLEAIVKHTQHPENTCNICVKHMQHPNKHTCNVRLEKTDETFGTDACNIRVEPLQHMQHPDLLLQHTYENTCNIPLKHLKHLKCTLATCVFKCNIYLLLGQIETRGCGA
jgi:hypothetical protein